MNGPRAGERPARRDIAWVAGACAVSFALGLAFVFIRAPHPWGWQGFDHYDDLGRTLAGVALGCAAQLRPNLLLLPLAVGAVMLWRRVPLVTVALVCAAAVAIDVPWIVRNARVSGKFIPTTTRGGVQLWYGTVQVPPF